MWGAGARKSLGQAPLSLCGVRDEGPGGFALRAMGPLGWEDVGPTLVGGWRNVVSPIRE